MIDINLLRNDRNALAESLRRRGVEFDLEELAALDTERRGARSAAEVLRAEQKTAGKSIATLQGSDKQAAIEAAAKLSEDYKGLIALADDLDERFNAIWIRLPNMTDPTAADGLEEEDAVEVKRVGTAPTFGFDIKDHVELGTALGVLDVERASKVSGSRFGFVMGDLAIMEFALVRYA